MNTVTEAEFKTRVINAINAGPSDQVLEAIAYFCWLSRWLDCDESRTLEAWLMCPHRVEVKYFKPDGECWASSEWSSSLTDIHDIWKEARDINPGLGVEGKEFDMLISVPTHPCNVVKLIRRGQEC